MKLSVYISLPEIGYKGILGGGGKLPPQLPYLRKIDYDLPFSGSILSQDLGHQLSLGLALHPGSAIAVVRRHLN